MKLVIKSEAYCGCSVALQGSSLKNDVGTEACLGMIKLKKYRGDNPFPKLVPAFSVGRQLIVNRSMGF